MPPKFSGTSEKSHGAVPVLRREGERQQNPEQLEKGLGKSELLSDYVCSVKLVGRQLDMSPEVQTTV